MIMAIPSKGMEKGLAQTAAYAKILVCKQLGMYINISGVFFIINNTKEKLS